MISLLITIIILGVIAWIVFWALDYIGLSEPFAKIAKVILVLIIVVYLLSVLVPFLGLGHATSFPIK